MNLIANPQHAFHRGENAVFALFSGEQLRRLADLPSEPDPGLVLRLTELAEKSNECDLTSQ